METVESYHALKTGKLVALSTEQIVDCDRNDEGCGGGLPSTAYGYIQGAKGLVSAASYPYKAGNTGSGSACPGSLPSAPVSNILSYTSITGGETGLYNHLSSASGGPLSICVGASSWQNYQGGVLTQCDSNVDHCVQLTGYEDWGTSSAVWRVRNQWGTSWGEAGFMRIKVGSDLCALADWATFVSAT